MQEALELLDEHPEGLPVTVAPAWEDEFRWSFADLPGGELRAPGEDDEENG